MTNTLDYILGISDSNLEQKTISQEINTPKLNKTKKNQKNNTNDTNTTNTNDTNTRDTNDTSDTSDTNNIDKILNNGLVKFDNKMQTSMYFVCYKTMNEFCNNIKTTHNITIPKDFIDNHILTNLPNLIKEYTGNLKKRCKKIINLEMICIGRKLDGKQCTRKKHNDTEFCRSHYIKLSNGRIDQPEQIIIRNKRGRKRKVEFDPRQYDNDYITLWEDIINGEKVLIDNNNNIYTFDLEKPHYIGKKNIENKIDIVTILKNIASKKIDLIINKVEEPIIVEDKPILVEDIPILKNKIELKLKKNNINKSIKDTKSIKDKK